MISGLENILTQPIIGLKNKPDVGAGYMGKKGDADLHSPFLPA